MTAAPRMMSAHGSSADINTDTDDGTNSGSTVAAGSAFSVSAIAVVGAAAWVCEVLAIAILAAMVREEMDFSVCETLSHFIVTANSLFFLYASY